MFGQAWVRILQYCHANILKHSLCKILSAGSFYLNGKLFLGAKNIQL